MMTCVSLRSGVASSGVVTIAHHPAMHAAPINVNTASLCFTENSMTIWIIVISRTLASKLCPRTSSEIPLCSAAKRSSGRCRDKREYSRNLPLWLDPHACHNPDPLQFLLQPLARTCQLGYPRGAEAQLPAPVISADFLSQRETSRQQRRAHPAEHPSVFLPFRHHAILFRPREARKYLRLAGRKRAPALRNRPMRPPEPLDQA